MTDSDRKVIVAAGALGNEVPLLTHALDEPAAFRPETLVESVKALRGIDAVRIPELCVLEYDGDLTDKLIERGEVRASEQWPCFHTQMWLWPADAPRCGIVARTIGGPYTVLIAEQLAMCGVRAVVGLASAGRVSPTLPLPALAVADEAVRDEGTSYHYLPPTETVPGFEPLASALEGALADVGLPVRRGLVWTTDAPYRETRSQLAHWAARNVLAVEMQAASLFAFGRTHDLPVGLVAHVTNAVDHGGEQFHKGPEDLDFLILEAICRAAESMS